MTMGAPPCTEWCRALPAAPAAAPIASTRLIATTVRGITIPSTLSSYRGAPQFVCPYGAGFVSGLDRSRVTRHADPLLGNLIRVRPGVADDVQSVVDIPKDEQPVIRVDVTEVDQIGRAGGRLALRQPRPVRLHHGVRGDLMGPSHLFHRLAE